MATKVTHQTSDLHGGHAVSALLIPITLYLVMAVIRNVSMMVVNILGNDRYSIALIEPGAVLFLYVAAALLSTILIVLMLPPARWLAWFAPRARAEALPRYGMTTYLWTLGLSLAAGELAGPLVLPGLLGKQAMMDTYLTLGEAARLMNATELRLNQLVRVGTIRSVKTSSGEVLVNEKDMERVIESGFQELEGIPIGIGEAAREYGVPHQTISRWYRNGYIDKIGAEGQKVLLNRRQVAIQVHLYRLNPGQGRWTVRKANKT